MRIASINMIHTGSTGKIMLGIAECAREHNYEVHTFSPNIYYVRQKMDAPFIKDHSYFGFVKENMLHLALSQASGIFECFSWFGTRGLIRRLDQINPDIIHLHNLHNNSIDVRSLFKYIKRKQIKVVWTLHDCWSMTGKCPHFTVAKCDKWKTGCHHCPVLREYPKTYLDQTKLMWRMKKKWFTGVKDMVIVTPSEWLADIVKQSYLSDYPLKVINNGIDLSVFKPTYADVRQCYGIPTDKHIVLGVAPGWDNKKGLDVFLKLAERLQEQYQIVLVGTNETLDQILPKNIVSIHRTQNQHELAELYTTATVFVNPTREENFPTVNIEALACGTPVVTFETGGSPEIPDKTCGIVVPCNDVDDMQRAICRVCKDKMFSDAACLKRARCFDKHDKFSEYIDLYKQIYTQGK